MFEVEPDCPGVMEMAFNSAAPIMTYNARRMLCSIDRIQSVRLTKDVDELVTWSVALQNIASDLLLKEVEYKVDSRVLGAVNVAVGTQPNKVMRATGSVHYHVVHDGLTRTALAHSMNYIPSLGSENGLTSKVLLMNNITFNEFLKWTPLEAGEDFTTDILKNGVSVVESGLFGVKFVVTIKHKLVPHGTVYHFADTKYVGQQFVWKEPTMIVKEHDFSMEFGVFCSRGGGIPIFLGMSRVDYTGVGIG
jgi:hypothetical protein